MQVIFLHSIKAFYYSSFYKLIALLIIQLNNHELQVFNPDLLAMVL